jgi:hypothetical protein
MTNNIINQNIIISFHSEPPINKEKEKENEMNIINLINEIELIDYSENYTIKELSKISAYYGNTKKMNKQQIIEFLINFETDIMNADIVLKRQNMWFYINQLKNDKFMEKFVILW